MSADWVSKAWRIILDPANAIDDKGRMAMSQEDGSAPGDFGNNLRRLLPESH